MTGASCLARAVVPRTAAAVDHADTELIGHRGWKGTGFLCDAIFMIENFQKFYLPEGKKIEPQMILLN